jgi:prolyl-tRNA synthetase
MKQSEIHIKTLKESPFEGKMESQHLMFRAGMMKKNGAGDYTLMPYGVALYNVLKEKVDQLFGHMAYQELHSLSYDEREVLGQIRGDVVSYKDLPLLFQIDSMAKRHKHSVKHGLLKSRVTPIKGLQLLWPDQETFDCELKNLWNQMIELHQELDIPFHMTRLFDEAGAMVKSGTWLPTPHGDETFYKCQSCAYCSDEIGATWQFEEVAETQVPAFEEILTPDVKTIADLETFLSIRAEDLMKTLLLECQIKGKPLTLAVVVRGDRDLNVSKVARYMGISTDAIEMVTDLEVVEAAGTVVGFAGPIGIKDVMLLVDEEVAQGQAMVTGANRRDYHLKNVVYGRDFQTKHLGDFSTVKEGDLCPVCGEPLVAEVGYTITTIKNYNDDLSKHMDIKFKNDQMKEERPFIALGQIDLYRLMVAYLDYHFDDGGFSLKETLTPYDVHVVIPNIKKEDQCVVADQILFELESKGKRVLLDNRKGSAGAKFKDSDLLGIPVRITAGKLAADGVVELKYRNCDEKIELTIKEVLEKF